MYSTRKYLDKIFTELFMIVWFGLFYDLFMISLFSVSFETFYSSYYKFITNNIKKLWNCYANLSNTTILLHWRLTLWPGLQNLSWILKSFLNLQFIERGTMGNSIDITMVILKLDKNIGLNILIKQKKNQANPKNKTKKLWKNVKFYKLK